MPNVPFFGRAQIVLKLCSKRMQDRNVFASKLKLGQLILRKIIGIVATGCHLLKLKCIKFDIGWGCAPEPAGEFTALPRPAGFKGPTSKGAEGKGKGRASRIFRLVCLQPYNRIS